MSDEQPTPDPVIIARPPTPINVEDTQSPQAPAKETENNTEAKADETVEVKSDEKVEAKAENKTEVKIEEAPPTLVRSIPSVDDVKLRNPNEVILDRMYQLLTDRLKNKPLTNANIIEIVGISIQLVEKAKKDQLFLTNEDKKSIVTNLIIKLIQSTPMDDELKSYFTNIFIPLMLSSTIDNLCSLNVNDIKRGLFSCCK
jgi:hypothetical protein